MPGRNLNTQGASFFHSCKCMSIDLDKNSLRAVTLALLSEVPNQHSVLLNRMMSCQLNGKSIQRGVEHLRTLGKVILV